MQLRSRDPDYYRKSGITPGLHPLAKVFIPGTGQAVPAVNPAMESPSVDTAYRMRQKLSLISPACGEFMDVRGVAATKTTER